LDEDKTLEPHQEADEISCSNLSADEEENQDIILGQNQAASFDYNS